MTLSVLSKNVCFFTQSKFLTPKKKREIPKIMLDNPKNVAWQSSSIISGIVSWIPKIMRDSKLSILSTHLISSLSGNISGIISEIPKTMPDNYLYRTSVQMIDSQLSGNIIGIIRNQFLDLMFIFRVQKEAKTW